MANVNRYLKLKKEQIFKQADFSMPGQDLTLYTKTATVAPVHSEIEIKTGYKRGGQIVGPGMVSADVNIETAADLDQLAYFLHKALGGYVTEQDPLETELSHYFYTDEKFVLNSFGVLAGMDDHEAISKGVGVNTMSIGVSGGELNLVINGIGSTYDKQAMSTPVNAADFDNLDFLTFADVQVFLDDVNISCPETKEFTININNGMSVEDGQRVGSRERCLNIAGDIEVTVDFTMYRNSTKFLEAYLGGVNTFGVNGATTHELKFIITDRNSGHSMTILMPEVRSTSNTYDTSGNDLADESSTFKANLGSATFNGFVFETLLAAQLIKDLNFVL